jgi:hypothetical protein
MTFTPSNSSGHGVPKVFWVTVRYFGTCTFNGVTQTFNMLSGSINSMTATYDTVRGQQNYPTLLLYFGNPSPTAGTYVITIGGAVSNNSELGLMYLPDGHIGCTATGSNGNPQSATVTLSNGMMNISATGILVQNSYAGVSGTLDFNIYYPL